MAILLALEILRKSWETAIWNSELFHDGFNIGGSYVTVGDFHEVKEAFNSGYDQGFNIVKVDSIVTEIDLLTVEFLFVKLALFWSMLK